MTKEKLYIYIASSQGETSYKLVKAKDALEASIKLKICLTNILEEDDSLEEDERLKPVEYLRKEIKRKGYYYLDKDCELIVEKNRYKYNGWSSGDSCIDEIVPFKSRLIKLQDRKF